MPKKANIFESFSHSAIQQFKEAFGIMDTDKDGLLSASDLVAAFGAHGKSIGSGDAQVRKRIKNFKKKFVHDLDTCRHLNQNSIWMVSVFCAHMKTLLFGARLELSCSQKLIDNIFLQLFLDNARQWNATFWSYLIKW